MMVSNHSTPEQYFRESCLADHGYCFVRWERDCTIWKFCGVNSKTIEMVKVTPTGDTINIPVVENELQLNPEKT